jgi:hypothetical protein
MGGYLMDYQVVLETYRKAVMLRDLKVDDNYKLLKEIFREKIINSVSLTSPVSIIAYLSGIKDVFNYVDSESAKIDFYKEDLDKFFQDTNI